MLSSVKMPLAAFVVATTLAGVSHAAMSPADQALAKDSHPRFILSTPDEIEKHDIMQDYLYSLGPNSPEVRELHAAIRENPTLQRQLQARHLELNNLIYADRAADGSFVLYMR